MRPADSLPISDVRPADLDDAPEAGDACLLMARAAIAGLEDAWAGRLLTDDELQQALTTVTAR